MIRVSLVCRDFRISLNQVSLRSIKLTLLISHKVITEIVQTMEDSRNRVQKTVRKSIQLFPLHLLLLKKLNI